ncbi:tetratricopeptide repeat protein [Nonomuraea turkmeniaca]|nr:tetratricopeptide repeat protein [Nonomuraea turkmeniaca]
MKASAYDNSQMAVQGEGTQHVHFHGVSRPHVTLLPMVAPPPMVGRDGEIAALVGKVDAALREGRPLLISAVHGMAGVGKTALARAVAVQVKERFTDARVEVDLYGFTPDTDPADPRDVLAELLGWAGFEAADIPGSLDGRSRLWRGWLAGRRVLLLLDNVRTVEQVMPLLPQDAPHCLTLITSRSSLDDLDDADRLPVDLLDPPEAVSLLRRRARRPLAGDGILADVARLCGWLPLALDPVGRLLARQDPAMVLELMTEAMRDGGRRFRHMTKVDQAIRAAFTVSYQALDTGQRQVLRCCAWHPGPDFDVRSIAPLAGLSPSVTRLRLDELAAEAMLTRQPTDRYGFHDVFLECARRQADAEDSADERRAGHDRLYATLRDHVRIAISMLTTTAPGDPSFGSPGQARSWLMAATSEVRVAADIALAQRHPKALALANEVAWWLRLNDRYLQAHDLYTAMRNTAVAQGDRSGQAGAMYGLASVAAMRGEFGQAEEAYRQARGLYEEIGNESGQADAMHGLGDVAFVRGEFGPAEEAYRQARGLYEGTGDRTGQAHALQGLGDVAFTRGEFAPAAQAYRQARRLFEEIGDRLGQAGAMWRLGDIARMRDEDGPAEEAYRQAHSLYEEIGDRLGQAHALRGLGEVASMRGDDGSAEEAFTQARDLYEEIGNRLGQANAILGLAQLAHARDHKHEAGLAYAAAAEIYQSIGLDYWADLCRAERENVVEDY